MRVLIYGSRGWIGGLLKKFLSGQNVSTIDGHARCQNAAEVEGEIHSIRPTHIICLIGRTSGPGFNNIDYLEQPGKLVENVTDNLEGPLVLAELCRKHSIHMTYFGTGCIFSYWDDSKAMEHQFTEEDDPNFFGSSYSVVKGKTDILMRRLFPDVLNLRIRMPISREDHPRNFLTKIISYPRIYSTLNSMTVLEDFFPILLDMIRKRQSGTFNFVNPQPVNHAQILELYHQYINPHHSYTLVGESEHNAVLVKAHRSKNVLSVKKLLELYPDIPPTLVSIVNIFRDINSTFGKHHGDPHSEQNRHLDVHY